MFLLFTLSCAPNVIELYARERDVALATASELPTNWSPDASLEISKAGLNLVMGAALKAEVEKEAPPIEIGLPLGRKASISPHLVVDKVSIAPSDACSPCVSLKGALLGKAPWNVDFVKGSFPFEVTADAVLAFEVVDNREVRVRLKELKSVNVRVLEIAGLGLNPSNALETWVARRVLEKLPPVTVTTLDSASLPLRGVRLLTRSDVLRVELLTDVPDSKPIPSRTSTAHDAEVVLSETALLGLARRAAFNKGTLTLDVAVDPRVLMVNEQGFTLGLRLWRLVGRGWWRDYTVTGSLLAEGGKVKLKTERVDEAGKSPGAGFVDPLAALLEGQITRVLEDALSQSLPGRRAEDLGGARIAAVVESVRGETGAMVVGARLAVVSGP